LLGVFGCQQAFSATPRQPFPKFCSAPLACKLPHRSYQDRRSAGFQHLRQLLQYVITVGLLALCAVFVNGARVFQLPAFLRFAIGRVAVIGKSKLRLPSVEQAIPPFFVRPLAKLLSVAIQAMSFITLLMPENFALRQSFTRGP